MDYEAINQRIAELENENAELKKENRRLLRQILFLEEDKTISESLRVESLVARLVRGLLSSNSASYDVALEHRNLKFEVKFSKINIADRKSGAPTKRWAWAKPFGESGNKIFDNLILIGIIDEQYRHFYLHSTGKFIIFDVPYDEIMPLTIQTNRGRYRSIQLTTNPQTARSAASPLFAKYQITSADLEARYRKFFDNK
jgi:hypothetical protein